MSQKIRLAVDLMGTDHGPQTLITACYQMVNNYDNLSLILIGTKLVVDQIAIHDQIQTLVAKEVITQSDSPLVIRRKVQSSMAKGIALLEEKQVDGFVSGGNSGALVTLATLKLPMLPKISKIGFMPFIPQINHGYDLALVDVGANLTVSAEDLVGFGRIAVVFYHHLFDFPNPKIAILNVGTEKQKGFVYHQKASQILANTKGINFGGFVEPAAVFNGQYQVIVTDGYGGNILLKTAEGLITVLKQYFQQEYQKPSRWLGYFFSKKLFSQLKKQISYQQRAAAIVLGSEGLIVKTHGSAQVSEFFSALQLAYLSSQKKIISKVIHALN